jgi:hypothetical protein
MPWRLESRFSRDPAHKLLIHAAVDKGELGSQSFQAWKKQVSLTDIDYPSQKMLSAVSHHITDDEVSQQVLKVAKFTWIRSQTLLRAGLRAEQALRQAGIPTAWIKGAAILARTTTKVSERPMEDIDLLIPIEYLPQATLCLNAAGFHSPADYELVNCPERITHNSHAIAFEDSAGAEVDVHWQTLKGDRQPAIEERVWLRASKATLLDQDTDVISPEDLLLHVIATNREGNDAYWVVDAIRIIEDNPFDFALFLDLARERRLGRPSFAALSIIHTFRPGVIPRRYQLASKLVRLAEAAGNLLLRNIVVLNMKEAFQLHVPRSITPEHARLSPNKNNPCANFPLIESEGGTFSIDFGDENPKRYRHPAATWNWHHTEPTGIWTSSRLAHLDLDLPEHLSSITVKASYTVISSPFARVRSIGIYTDGKLADKKILKDPFGIAQESEFRVTREQPSKPLTISFRVSSTIIPRRHRMNLDQRPLGIFLERILIQETTE